MAESWLTIKMNRPAMQQLAEQSSLAACERAGRRTVERSRRILREGNHNRTGRLSASLTSAALKTSDRTTVIVGSPLRYAKWVEFGRGPVYPVRAKALRFVIDGKVIYAKRVGPAKPVRFLSRALRQLTAQDFAE